MGPTGPNSSSCGGPAVARMQELALLARDKLRNQFVFSIVNHHIKDMGILQGKLYIGQILFIDYHMNE